MDDYRHRMRTISHTKDKHAFKKWIDVLIVEDFVLLDAPLFHFIYKLDYRAPNNFIPSQRLAKHNF